MHRFSEELQPPVVFVQYWRGQLAGEIRDQRVQNGGCISDRLTNRVLKIIFLYALGFNYGIFEILQIY